jgi:predicted NUDIX family NTP pyrophosphohydrolase
LRQRGGKLIKAFALEGDFGTAMLRSHLFEMEWPPRSGRVQLFAEVDRGEWLDLTLARDNLLVGQRPYLDRLVALVEGSRRR